MKPSRILFQSYSRRGLGHLMRGLNLAREIRLLVPSVEMLFYIRSRAAAALCGGNVPCFIETNADGTTHWPDVLRSFAPDVVIYDTLLPKDPANEPTPAVARSVYIMRKSKAEKQQGIFDNPFLDRVDLILIPHTPEEFAYVIPSALKRKSVFVGPIVRSPDQASQQQLREKYRIGTDDFLLTSTAGGGGFTAQAESFFATVFAVHRRLCTAIPRLRHLVIQGPNFAASLPALEGITIVDQEPDMVNLLALSNLVIAEGGYNTVNEIRLAKTPAVFLPSARNFDDQEERVRELAAQGLAVVFTQGDPTAIAQTILELCSTESGLRAIQQRYAADRMETGNRTAAEHIVRLVNQ